MNLPSLPVSLRRDAVENYRKWLLDQGLTKKTVENYVSDFRRWLVWLNDRPGLLNSDLTPAAESYLEDLAVGHPQSTVNRRTAALRRFADYLVQGENQGWNLSQQLFGGSAKRPSAWTEWTDRFSVALAQEGCNDTQLQNYVGDVSLFLSKFPQQDLEQTLNKYEVARHLREMRQKGAATLNLSETRKSLHKFAAWATDSGYFLQNPLGTWWSNLVHSSQFGSALPQRLNSDRLSKLPNWRRWYLAYHRLPFTNALHLAVLVVFASMLTVFAFRQFGSQVASPFAYPSAPVRPNRQLSFQGRLTDSVGTPITTGTNVVFRLYDADTAGTELWTSGTCSIDPDQDGIFSTALGDTCGTEIPENVFSEMANVWLQIEVGGEILEPRQQISSVPFALNTETVQGFPVSLNGEINTIPVINALGQLIIGASNPSIIASSGAFLIQGESLTFATEGGGDITLQPGVGGTIEAIADTNITGDLSATGQLVLSSYTTSGGLLYTDSVGTVAQTAAGANGECLISTGGGAPGFGSCSAAVADSIPWQVQNGAANLKNPTIDVLIGGTSTASAKFAFLNVNSGTPTASISAGTTGGLYLTASGSAQTTARQPLSFGGGTTGNIIFNNRNNTPLAVLDTVNNRLGIGVNAPANAIDAYGNLQLNGVYSGATTLVISPGGSDASITATGNNSLQVNTGLGWLISQRTGNTGYGALLLSSSQASRIEYNGGASDAAYMGFWTRGTAGASTERMRITGLGYVGIGTTAPTSNFHLEGFYGGNALARFNATGGGDILTASASGTTRFVIQQDGDVGIGIAYPGYGLDVNDDARVVGDLHLSGGNTYVYGSGKKVVFYDDRLLGFGGGAGTQDASFGWNSADDTFRIGGGTNLTSTPWLRINTSGIVSIDSLNVAGGVVYTDANGALASVAGASGECLISTGTTAPDWDSCAGAVSGSIPWQVTNGTANLKNTTLDMLVGGTSSASAKFAFLNVNSGTPTASISAGTSGATYLTATGGLNTTAGQNLTLGTSGTTYFTIRNDGAIIQSVGGRTNLRIIDNGTGLNGSVSIGTNANATGNAAIAIGASSVAAGNYGIAIGPENNAGLSSTAIGRYVQANSGNSQHFFGQNLGGSSNNSSILIGSGLGAVAQLLGQPTTSSETGLIQSARVPQVSVRGLTSSTATAWTASGTTVTATAHGLSVGDPVVLTGVTNRTHTRVTAVTDANTFVVATAPDASGTGWSHYGTNRPFTVTNGTDGTGLFTITKTGYAGIGTTSPTEMLSVGPDTDVSAIIGRARIGKVVDAGSVDWASFGHYDRWNASEAALAQSSLGQTILNAASGQTLNLRIANSDRVVISSTGMTVSGTITLSAFTNNGGLLYTNGSGVVAQTAVGANGECLVSAGGGAPGWSSCSAAVSGSIPWQVTNGTANLKNTTLDMLVGGNSTTSAKFAFLNVNSGTPTASISAGTAGATFLTANGFLSTTARQDLTIGNSSTFNTTGNTYLNPNGTGQVVIGTNAAVGTNSLHVGNRASIYSTNSGIAALWLRSSAEGSIGSPVPVFQIGSFSGNSPLSIYDIGSGHSLFTSQNTINFRAQDATDVPVNIRGSATGVQTGNLLTLQKDASTTVAAFGADGQLGVGTGVPTSKLHVEGFHGGNALVRLNETGGNTILTASASGATRFYVTNSGAAWLADGLDTNSSANRLAANGITRIGGAAYQLISGSGRLDMRTPTSGLALSILDANNYVGIGDSTPASLFTVGSGDLFQIDNTGAIAAATGITSSGTITLSAFTNNGGLLYTNGSGVVAQTAVGANGECLVSAGGGAPGWSSCSAAVSGSIPWQVTNGTANLKNTTLDLLVGGDSTASAKFAVLNVNGSGPATASVSGNLIVMPYIGQGGRLGIGTTSPIAGLDVAGNAVIRGSTDTSDIISARTLSGTEVFKVRGFGDGFIAANLYFGAMNSSNRIGAGTMLLTSNQATGNTFARFVHNNGTIALDMLSNSHLILQQTVGNVGIGTATPTSKLHVEGFYAGNALARFNETGGNDILTASASGTTRFVIKNNGNVGIGTNAPTNLLSVNGVANFEGTVLIDYATHDFAGTAGGGIGFEQAAGTVSGFMGFYYNVDPLKILVGANGDNVVAIGALANSTQQFDSVPEVNPTLKIYSATAPDTDNTQWLSLTHNQTNGLITTGKGSLLLSSFDGNVGIGGDTTPNAMLSVGPNSEFQVNSAGNISTSGTLTLSAFTNNGGLLYTNGSGVVAQTAVGANGECLVSAGGGAPGWSSCSAAVSGSIPWQVTNGTANLKNTTLDLLVGGDSTASADFAVLNVNGTGPATASVSGDLIVMPKTGLGGRVGIGTTNPTNRLEVQTFGDLSPSYLFQTTVSAGGQGYDNSLILRKNYSNGSDTNNAMTGSLDFQGMSSSANVNLASIVGQHGSLGSRGALDFQTNDGTSLGTRMRLDYLGNLGIGTTSPNASAKIDILGGGFRMDSTGGTPNVQFELKNDTASLSLQNYSGNTAIGSSGTLLFMGGKTGGLGASIGGVEALRIFTNGHVTINENGGDQDFKVEGDTNANLLFTDASTDRIGIGTNAPQYMLDVRDAVQIIPSNGAKYLLTGSGTGTVFRLTNTSNIRTFELQDDTDIKYRSYNSADQVFQYNNGTTTTDLFRITDAGDVNVGTDTTPDARFTVGSSSQFQVNSSGAITAATGITSSGTITFSGLTDGLVRSTSGVLSGGYQVDLTADVTGILPIANGGTNSTATPTAGGIAYGTGTAYAFTAAGALGDCLISNNTGAPTWGSCSAAVATAVPWQVTNGTANLKNTTLDMLVGGDSTISAKFAFINVNSGTPTATIAGNLSLQVPTGVTPAANLNVLNGGTLSIKAATTGQGDAGLLTRATFTSQVGASNIVLYGRLTDTARTNFEALRVVGGSAGVPMVHINPNNQGAADTFQIFAVDGGATNDLFNIYGNGRDKVNIGSLDTTGAIRAHINTAATNYVGLAIEAFSGQTANLQEWQNSSGTALSVVDENGYLGIGTAAPGSPLTISQTISSAANVNLADIQFTKTSSDGNIAQGISVLGITQNSSAISNATTGISSILRHNGSSNTYGTVNGFAALSAGIQMTGSGTLHSGTGLYINSFSDSGAGSITNAYGLYLADQTVATNNYAIVTNAGNIVFNEGGDASTDFRVEGDTNANLLFVDASTDTIGIRTATPGYPLDVNGNARVTGLLRTEGASGGFQMDPRDGSGTAVQWYNPTGDDIKLYAGADRFAISAANGNITATGTITGLTGITSSGTITFSGLSDGLVRSTSGVLSGAGTVSLTTEVTGVLPIANGGTNASSVGSAGSIAYSTGSAYAFSAVGALGECLVSGNTGAPTWASCSTAVSGSIAWEVQNGAANLKNTSLDLLVGGNSTASADFAVLNVNGTGPATASVSGNLIVMQNTGLGGNVGIGTVNPQGMLDIRIPDSQGTNALFITDAGTSGSIVMRDATNNAATFEPNIRGTSSGASGRSFILQGNTVSGLDSGTTPITLFRSTIDNGTVSTRPLFQWQNNTTGLMTMLANGNLGLGTATPGQVLTVIKNSTGQNNATIANYGFTVGENGSGDLALGDFGTYKAIQSFAGDPLSINPAGNNVGIGTTGPDAKIDALATSGEQLRLTYTDGSVYTAFSVNSSGNLTIDNSGTTTTFSDALIVNGTTTLNGIFVLGDHGDVGSINTSDWDISTTGVMTGIGNITSDGNIVTTGYVQGSNFRGGLYYNDNRAASPSEFDAQEANYVFGSFSNNTTSPYSDGFVFRGWSDSSGGNDNMINFSRASIAARFYQQTYGSATDFTTYEEFAFTGTGGTANYIPKYSDANTIGNSAIIDVAGNIGIGDTTPDNKFTVGTTSQFQVNTSGAIAAATGITSSGTITFSAFTNNGGLLYTNGSGVVAQTAVGSNGECLVSAGGGSPTWGSCSSAVSGVIPWQVTNGTANLKNTTLDLLVGGSSTTSAKFAFTNVNSGNPTLKVSPGASTTIDPTLYLTDVNDQLGFKLWYDNDIGATYFDSQYDHVAGSMFFRTRVEGTPIDAFTIHSSGNVGVGDTSPDALFSVGATSQFLVNSSGIISRIDGVAHTIDDVSGSLTLTSNSTAVSIADALSVTGTITAATDETINGVDINAGAISDVTTLTVGGNTILGDATTDTVTMNGLLSSPFETAASLANLRLGCTGSACWTDANGAIEFYGTSASHGQMAYYPSVDGGSFAFLDSSSSFGDKGALTSSLTFEKVWVGAFYAKGAAVLDSSLTIGDASADTVTANAAAWTFANDTNFALTGGVNGLSFDTSTLSIDATNNRIGIGTTAPSATLDVTGNIRVTGSSQIYAENNENLTVGTTGTNGNLTLTTRDAMVFTFGAMDGDESFVIRNSSAENLFLLDPNAEDLELGDADAGGSSFTVFGADGFTNFQGTNLTLRAGNAGGGAGNLNGGDLFLYGGAKNLSGADGDVILAHNGTSALGNVGIGDSSPAALLTVGSGDLFQVNSSGAIAAATGITSSGTITFSGLSDGLVRSTSGVLSGAGTVSLTTEVTGVLPIANGGTNSTATPTNGGIAYGTGTAYAFTSAGSTGECLQSNGAGAPTWGSCAAGSSNFWTIANGAIYPTNATTDMLIGGTSSASAKFAFLNVTTGTPTASISAGTAGATFLTADGYLSTTARQPLTIGNSAAYNTSGDTYINPNGTGNVSIGTSAIARALLEVEGNASMSGALYFRGTTDPKINVLNGENFGIRTSRGGDTGLSERFTVLTNGNVGVGTTTPEEEFHVEGGTTRLTHTANILELGDTEATYDWAFLQNADDLRIRDNNGSIVALTMQTLTGNVGVGTTAPDARLDALATTEQLRLTYTDGSVYTSFTTNASGDLTIAPTGADTFITGAIDISGGINAGASNAFQVSSTGVITTIADETINGIDISAGTVSDVVNLTINSGGDLTIGSIGLNDVGTTNITSGASLVGVFDEFTNSNSTTVQDVLDDLDAAIAAAGSWTLAGDTGTSQTIASGETANIVGGTNGIDTVASATDILTLNLDTTEIGTTTFGAASPFTWTFDAGATDPTIAFASNALTFTAGTNTFAGNVAIGNNTLSGGTAAIDFTNFDVTSGGNVTIGGTLGVTGISTFTGNVNANGGFDVDDVFVIADGGAMSTSGAADFNGDVSIADTNIALDGASTTLTSTGALTITPGGATLIGDGGDTLQINSSNWDVSSGGAISGLTGVTSSGTITFSGLSNGLVRSTSGVLSGAGTVSLTTEVTGTLPIANGGTNSTATPTAGGIAYGTGTAYAFTAAGVSNQCLLSNGAAAPTWGSCAGGITDEWTIASGALFANNTTTDMLIGGTSTASATFAFTNVNAGAPSLYINDGLESLVLQADTTTGVNFLSSSQGLQIYSGGNITINANSGTSDVNIQGDANLSNGSVFKIFGSTVLSDNTLGSGVISSSLVTVGALNAGSITSGFGTIDNADTITGTTLNGTTGINTGASAGTQRIDASGNLVNIGTITASGAITAATDETINGIDISAGTVSDVVNLTINTAGDLTIGSIGLNDVGSSNITSGASLIGVFDELDNSASLTLQDVLDDLDAAITSAAAGAYSGWTLAGNTGSEAINSGDTAVIQGGTNGIDTSVGATDTLTIDLDTTEIATATFGSGSGFTWTFDAGVTDPTIAFATGAINLANGNLTLGGTTETLANTGFLMDGNDLFVAGMAGFEGNLYTDGAFIAGASTHYGNGTITQTTGETLTIGTTNAGLTLQTTTAGDITLNPVGDVVVQSALRLNGTDINGSSNETRITLDDSTDYTNLIGNVRITNGVGTVNFVESSGDLVLTPSGGQITAAGDYNVTTGNDYQVNGTVVLNATTLGSSVVNSSLTSVGTLTSLTVAGTITANTAETINGVDISAGTVSDVVNLSINTGGDLTIGGIALSAAGASSVTSGASIIGVFDEFTNSSGIRVQDVLADLDSAITTLSSSGWTLAGDSGTQTISMGNTANIVGGTNGIDTIASATDILTLNLDTTEIGTTTFGSGSAITWTFNASGGTDATMAFGDGSLAYDTATMYLNATTNRAGFGTTGPGVAVEINDSAGSNLRLTYNDNNGSPTTYTDFLMSSGGVLTIDPTGGQLTVDGDVNVTTGNDYRINGTVVLNATTLGSGVTASSLTSVGTLTSLSTAGAVNINTGVSTTVNIGNNAGQVGILTGSWDITTAGVASGFTGITTSGSITKSDGGGYLVVGDEGTTNEGGHIVLNGWSTQDDWNVDLLSNSMRFFNSSSNTTEVQIFNAGAGVSSLNVEGYVLAKAGTNSSPSFTFSGDADTGMYSSGSNIIEFTAGGFKALEINSSIGLLLSNSVADGVTCSSTTEGALVYDRDAATLGGIYYCRQTGSGVWQWRFIDNTAVIAQNPDLAEYAWASDLSLDGGDIVSVTNASEARENFYDRFNIVRASSNASKKVLGVVSSDPGIILNKPDTSTDIIGVENAVDPHLKPLTLAGRVPVKVVASAPLEQGDRIGLSEEFAGIGKRLTGSGYSVGTVLTAFNPTTATCTDISHPSQAAWSNSNKDACFRLPDGRVLTKVLVLVNNEYSLADASLQEDGSFTLGGTTGTALRVVDELGAQTASITASGAATFRNVAAQEMSSRFITAESMLITGDATVEGTLSAQSARFSALQANGATVSGTLYADNLVGNISADSVTGLEDRIAALVAAQNASMSATPEPDPETQGDIDTLGNGSGLASGSGELVELPGDLIVNGMLNAVGGLVTSTLIVDGTTITNSDFSFVTDAECTLETGCNIFAFQPSGVGTINFLNNLVVMTDGTVTINGDLTVTGAVAAGEIQTDRLVAQGQSLTVDLASASASTPEGDVLGSLIIRGNDGKEVANYSADGMSRFLQLSLTAEAATADTTNEDQSEELESSSGTALLKTGKTEFKIRTSMAKADSLVYLTATSATGNKVLYMKSQADGEFTVAIDGAHDADITFNWWVVGR